MRVIKELLLAAIVTVIFFAVLMALLPSRASVVRNLEIHHLIDKTAGVVRLPRPVGCEACERTGRKGRVPVLEILSLQEDMRAMLAAGAPPAELLEKAGQAGQFISFTRYARLLIGRKLLAPADALHVVAE